MERQTLAELAKFGRPSIVAMFQIRQLWGQAVGKNKALLSNLSSGLSVYQTFVTILTYCHVFDVSFTSASIGQLSRLLTALACTDCCLGANKRLEVNKSPAAQRTEISQFFVLGL